MARQPRARAHMARDAMIDLRNEPLIDAVLRHLQGRQTSHEERAWRLLVMQVLAASERPWNDAAVRAVVHREGRALYGMRHSVTLARRSLLRGRLEPRHPRPYGTRVSPARDARPPAASLCRSRLRS